MSNAAANIAILKQNISDIAGRRFGRWTVLAIHPERVRYGKISCVLWLARCDCGSERIVFAATLRSGVSKSCGCFRREQAIKQNTRHGHTSGGRRSLAYARWQGMLRRCFNPNVRQYCWYGGRGITVCERWLKFENFYADMSDPPPGLSLDRINVNGDYEPGNCRWATPTEQVRNRRPPKRKQRRSTLAEIQAYAASLARAGSRMTVLSDEKPKMTTSERETCYE
jgi:hypothetical protein